MTFKILNGDCRDVLKTYPDNHFSALVTDPPYGLTQDRGPEDLRACLRAWLALEEHGAGRRGFMGRTWDGTVPGPDIWQEVYRVLKPGAHGAVFASDRTSPDMAISLRLAGFEIRQGLQWIYGSGFPKSQNIGKAIDRAAGAERVRLSTHRSGKNRTCMSGDYKGEYHVSCPSTPEAQVWEGYGTALKPAYEPIWLVRKPLPRGYTIARTAQEHGTAALNIDACRVPTTEAPEAIYAGVSGPIGGGGAYAGSEPENRPVVQGHHGGRWPSNVVLSHLPGCRQAGLREVKGGAGWSGTSGFGKRVYGKGWAPDGISRRQDRETVQTWDCEEGCPVKALGGQSGESASKPRTPSQLHHKGSSTTFQRGSETSTHNDGGTAARFFHQFDPPFLYCAKASRSEREAGCDQVAPVSASEATGGRAEGSRGLDSPRAGASRTQGSEGVRNDHPTVNPADLMEWLVRLVCPTVPGFEPVVLDPFCGSGSSGLGAVRAGVAFVGVDLSPRYCEIARARLEYCDPAQALQDRAEGSGSKDLLTKDGQGRLF